MTLGRSHQRPARERSVTVAWCLLFCFIEIFVLKNANVCKTKMNSIYSTFARTLFANVKYQIKEHLTELKGKKGSLKRSKHKLERDYLKPQQQHYICSFTNGRNMHVYFLVIFHCLLDKDMEIYVTCILKVMKQLWDIEITLSHRKCIKD